MLEVAFFSGMRRSEIFKLQERDLDFVMKLISIRDPKSGKVQETIGMSDVVAGVFREQIESNRVLRPDLSIKYVFPGRIDGKPRVECNAVQNVNEKAGLPKDFRPFHGLRHHFGVTLANSGKVSISDISKALTHKNLDFTKKRYAQFLPETLAAIGNTAANILETKNDAG